jgi:hypothetical protein
MNNPFLEGVMDALKLCWSIAILILLIDIQNILRGKR